jgi:hypothetical protein
MITSRMRLIREGVYAPENDIKTTAATDSQKHEYTPSTREKKEQLPGHECGLRWIERNNLS